MASTALRFRDLYHYIVLMNDLLQAQPNEQLAKLRHELRMGLPINAEFGAFWAIEHLSAERFHALSELGFPLQVIISQPRAMDLKLSHDPSRDASLSLFSGYPYEKLLALSDPSMDLDYPGKGPLAQSDIDKDQMRAVLDFCRSARTLPAVITIGETLSFASDFITSTPNNGTNIKAVSSARVPLKFAKNSTVQVYRSTDLDEEHYAVIIGDQSSEQPLVRVHSACFTGDCLGSLKCDCGPQLHEALRSIEIDGGILLYLSQEGRGIGMANKMRAYKLQDQGFDTVEANHRLGFADDEREFGIAAEMLKKLNKTTIRLLTNNPRKISLLEKSGIKVVERVPLQIKAGKENTAYLDTKANKSGHLL